MDRQATTQQVKPTWMLLELLVVLLPGSIERHARLRFAKCPAGSVDHFERYRSLFTNHACVWRRGGVEQRERREGCPKKSRGYE